MKQLRHNDPPSEIAGTRGTVERSIQYDPIKKFENVRLAPNKPSNWTREVEEDEGADAVPFEMPSFDHLEGNQWTDDSLQFNNMSKSVSGSHLDRWNRGDSDRGTSWRENMQTKRDDVKSSSDSSSSSSAAAAAAAPSNAFAEGGGADEWGRVSPSSKAEQDSEQHQRASESAGRAQTPSATGNSWDTGGFDFADMDASAAVGREASRQVDRGRSSRAQSRADNRVPPRERKQQQSQESPRGRRGRTGNAIQQPVNKDTLQRKHNAKTGSADHSQSFWNDF